MKFTPALSPREVEQALKAEFSTITAIPDGIGGQGVVFRAVAKAPISGENVALKIYFPGAIPERTQREVNSLRRIANTALVTLHSSGKVHIRGQECLFVATRFLDGDLLSNKIRNAPQDVPLCARIGRDLACAIEAMWNERVVHRDIKPTNIMLTADGRAVLFDLGVARHLAMESLTTLGKTWGTQGYMSPEQARAIRQLSCKTDLFSLGIVMQEVLLGRHPVGNNQMHLINGGPAMSSLRKGLPEKFANCVDALVARDPHRRPTPSQVIETLTKWI